MTITRLLQMALPAVAALGLASAPARGQQAKSNNGELMLGFRASGGAGVLKNYVVDLGPVSAFLSASTVQNIALPGVGADLSSADFYGASWHSRTNLFWGVVGANGNFAAIGAETPGTLYASKKESTNGVGAVAWERNYGGSHSTSTTIVESARSGFNGATVVPMNAPTLAVTQDITDSNSWSSFQPNASPISFLTWGPSIEGTPSQYLDLFKVVPLASGSNPALSTFVGRLVLETTGDLTFIPAAVIGVSTVQFASATFSAAEDNVTGKLQVTVTRTGDISTSTSVTVSTANGTALAGTDYTAIVGQAVNFAAGEASKTVDITVADRSGDQGSRDFTVTLGGVSGGTTVGAPASTTATITEAPSTIQLGATIFTANQEDTSVDVTITRTGGSAAVSVQISTVNGTATAVNNADFTALTNQVVNIPANIDSVTQTITLSHPAAVQGNKQFSVTLSSPSAGAALDQDTSLTTSTVRILATDLVAPTLAITEINDLTTANLIISGVPNGAVKVEGTVTDNVGVTSVQVTVDGGLTWTTAVVVNGNWTANNVHPPGGLTTVLAKATDARNNVKTATRTFTYKIVGGLTATPIGTGTITGVLASPTAYEVGKTYTITAVPGAGQVFDHWTGAGLTAPATELAKLTFVYSNALAGAPTITATFVANPFLAANNVIGSYNGLAKADVGTVASNSTNGVLSVTITATGTFSGTLKIDGVSLPISGLFDNVGVAKFGPGRTTTVNVPRTNKAPYVMALNLDVNPAGTKRITGSLKEFFRTTVVAQSLVVADRAAFSATAPVPANLLNQTTKGLYNCVLPARSAATVSLSGITLTNADFPQGDSIGSIALTKTGDITFSGTLSDGTAVTSTSKLDKNFASFVFAQLYTTKAGSIGGNFAFAATTDTDVAGSAFFWFRPWQSTHHYPWGWPEGLLTDLAGTKYATPATGTSALPGVGAVTPAGNARLTFSDGLLSPSVVKDLNISGTNVVTKLGTPADTSYTLTVTAATGAVAGTFTHDDGTKPAFKGIILNKGANHAAFGYFLTVAPKVITGEGQSGGISLIAK